MSRRPKVSDDHLEGMRGEVRASAADRPGVYRMLAENGEVLYVGKSKRVRTRLLSYFRCLYPEHKGARIVREARRIEWDYTPSEFAALLHELRLIKRFRPRYNVQMKRDVRHYAFIKITRGSAPKLNVVRGTGSEDGGVYYGPFLGAQRVSEAVRELSDALGLRDCPMDRRMHFADQRELFVLGPRTPGCIRHEIGKCLAPCIAACTESDYDERVVLARAFLDGADDSPMDALRSEMERASEELAFERAASCRDKLQRLETLREQFARLRFALETLSFVYTVPGHEGADHVYLVRRGRVRHEEAAPTAPKQHRQLAERVADLFSGAQRETGAVPAHEVDELLLLSTWFRRFPAELERATPADSWLRSRTTCRPVVAGKSPVAGTSSTATAALI